jgi:hypothetical protein
MNRNLVESILGKVCVKIAHFVPIQILVHLAKQFQRRVLEIDQSERSIAYGGHVCLWIKTKCALFVEDLLGMLPTTFQFIWPSGTNMAAIGNSCFWLVDF